jgi:plasmid stabilization system protein ParE
VAHNNAEEERRLLRAIKSDVEKLTALLDRARSHWEYEDPIYRFYHGSFKVYFVQALTTEIVSALSALLPRRDLNDHFLAIVREGTGKTFSTEVNARWDTATRPLLEAYFHARFFLEMVVKYGQELDEPPTPLPSGWAAVLYLYNLR